MNLSETLKALRVSSGAPQSQIAKAAGVSTTQYQNYEYGKSEPTATVLVALADFFDVSLDYMVGRSDYPDVVVLGKDGKPIVFIEAMSPPEK